MIDRCKECKGLYDCNRDNVGFKNGLRCKYNYRGTTNNNLIRQDKYNQFSCNNWELIKNHINDKHSIFVWGAYGIGKTHLLYFLANFYNKQGHNVYINKVSDIAQILREEINLNKSTNEIVKSEVNRMKEVSILFLDDIGNEQMTNFIHEAITNVIDYRYLHNKPTFISSNYDIEHLREVYTDKIGSIKAGQMCSRIKSFGVIEMKGKNWRN